VPSYPLLLACLPFIKWTIESDILPVNSDGPTCWLEFLLLNMLFLLILVLLLELEVAPTDFLLKKALIHGSIFKFSSLCFSLITESYFEFSSITRVLYINLFASIESIADRGDIYGFMNSLDRVDCELRLFATRIPFLT